MTTKAVMTAEQALRELVAGNQRFFATSQQYPRQTVARRREIARIQTPFAVILSCSDSRVPPELLFDQGLGDLYVVRCAGHVVDTSALGSLEHAVTLLGVPLILVLGHSGCGAVTAAVQGDPVEGAFGALLAGVAPAVALARTQSGNLLNNAIRAHLALTIAGLKRSPALGALASVGKLRISGAI